MTREPITPLVVTQLREIIESDAIDHEYNYMGAQLAAQAAGYDALAEFIQAADAATYYEAVQQAQPQSSSTS